MKQDICTRHMSLVISAPFSSTSTSQLGMKRFQGAASELKEDRERIKFLYGFVKNEELCFFGLPDELDDETPEVQALNRGLNTIHNRMMMLRRRYGCLLKVKKATTGDGKLIKKKMDSYKDELVIMKDQIVAKGGKYCMTPRSSMRTLSSSIDRLSKFCKVEC